MTELKKIISLARECSKPKPNPHTTDCYRNEYFTLDAEELKAFYHVVQAEAFEAAATHLNVLAMQVKRSMELGTEADDPSTWVTFDEAAAAIREMAKEQS